MSYNIEPEAYDAWYRTEKGQWIGDAEFSLLINMVHPVAGESLLDVGCGTGYFTKRFHDAGLHVSGVDPNNAMLQYAEAKNKEIEYLQASAYNLPFDNASFDYCTAITSLCFMKNPQLALIEMWRVSRKGVVLGLLNRYSLLHILKHNSEGYKGARWDTPSAVPDWSQQLSPAAEITIRSAVWCPLNSNLARWLETIVSTNLRYGGFLAISLIKKNP